MPLTTTPAKPKKLSYKEQQELDAMEVTLLAAEEVVAERHAGVEKASTALTTRSPAVIAAFADFYDSLKPQQQAQVREAMERRRGWWHRG